MTKHRNNLKERATTELAPFYLWVAYANGQIGRYYSLPSELHKQDRGAAKLLAILRDTPNPWNRAILYDNQARIRRAAEEEQVIARYKPMDFGR